MLYHYSSPNERKVQKKRFFHGKLANVSVSLPRFRSLAPRGDIVDDKRRGAPTPPSPPPPPPRARRGNRLTFKKESPLSPFPFPSPPFSLSQGGNFFPPSVSSSVPVGCIKNGSWGAKGGMEREGICPLEKHHKRHNPFNMWEKTGSRSNHKSRQNGGLYPLLPCLSIPTYLRNAKKEGKDRSKALMIFFPRISSEKRKNHLHLPLLLTGHHTDRTDRYSTYGKEKGGMEVGLLPSFRPLRLFAFCFLSQERDWPTSGGGRA